MTVWLVRAGRYGERETLALEQDLSVIRRGDLVIQVEQGRVAPRAGI